MPTDRDREIDFTTTRNMIKCCALAKIKPFSYELMAKEMNTDAAFLRSWYNKNLGIINKVIEIYRPEIDQEFNKLRSENNEED